MSRRVLGTVGDDKNRLKCRQLHANHDDCTPPPRIPPLELTRLSRT